MPVIYEDENLADAVHSAERSADDRSCDNLDGTSDGLQVPVNLDGEVLWIAGSPHNRYKLRRIKPLRRYSYKRPGKYKFTLIVT